MLPPVCVIDVVGLTPSQVGVGVPRLSALATQGQMRPLGGVVPAVTCTAQATMLTGDMPAKHGIVGNGWYFRDTGEVRFWLQSNRLLEAEPIYVTARRLAAQRGESFSCAKLFWWFNQGAAVEWSVTPKPHYGADGSKVFAIHGWPAELPEWLEGQLGPFPFHTFWGPTAGLPCSQWIAAAAAAVMDRFRPTLTLVYLPHLDYDLQRCGPQSSAAGERLSEVDGCAGTVIEAARRIGARVVVVSEYGLRPVKRPVFINRLLRQRGWLAVRHGPFGEMLDTFNSLAFAVADHQVAHVYVSDHSKLGAVAEELERLDGVGCVLDRAAQASHGLDHARSGDLVVLASPDAWFAYPYWLEDGRAPDFARTVDIHRKPGYDPCELFFDPDLRWPRLRLAWRLVQRKLGFRCLFDVVPLDASLVAGSHGLPPADPQHGPVLITDAAGDAPPDHMIGLKSWLLRLMGLGPDN